MVACKIAVLIADGHDPNQIAMISQDYANAVCIEKALRRLHVPLRASSRDEKALFACEPSVKLIRTHSSEEQEFDTVLVSGPGRQTQEYYDVATEARLLYVAMTRAMTSLTGPSTHAESQ